MCHFDMIRQRAHMDILNTYTPGKGLASLPKTGHEPQHTQEIQVRMLV